MTEGLSTRAGLQSLAVALARSPDVVSFARALVTGLPPADRLARLAALFRFVSALSESHPGTGEPRDAVDVLLTRLGEERGPAVVLSALLLAVGERAQLECTREMAFVRVTVRPEDLPRLPPYARPVRSREGAYLPLDPRRARPFGFLPATVREAVASRRRSGPAARLPAVSDR